ncbi:MAG: glycosyltransferase family 39 protein [Bacteroides sp.]|jgi:4-amino-4-deoxy-L-arabinose transferase-like glycosyltransferase|nr:glycosyltransferase family 39 protein [Bacteroides sp.]
MRILRIQKAKPIALRIIGLFGQYKYIFLLLPVFFFRDYTPDNELKYLNIAAEALKNHTWFTFCSQGEIYADKPPLYFWIIMLSKLITGKYYMWLIGLFSLLPAMGTLIIMDKWMRSSAMGQNRIVANILLLTTIMFAGGVLIVRMDMLMTFFIVLSLYTFFKIYQKRCHPIERFLLPVYIFLAVFTKGPLGFLIPIVSIVVFLLWKKQIRSFTHYFGWKQWSVMLGLCMIWFLGVFLEGGHEYLNNLLVKQTFGRGVNSFHHREPFWFYFPRMLWSFAPWILLYIVLIIQGVRKKMLKTDTQLFFAIICVTNIFMLSLISSKLDIYMLPVYPFLVYLSASFLPALAYNRIIKMSISIPAIIFILALPSSILLKKLIPNELSGILPYIGLGILCISGASAIIMLLKNKALNAITCIGYGILLLCFAGAFALPYYNNYIGYREMAETAKRAAETEHITNLFCYNFRTAPEMEVFIGQKIKDTQTIQQLDSLDKLQQKSILFIKSSDIRKETELREWLHSKIARWEAGNHQWYVIGGKE